jgi:hypothetical protein
MCTMADEFDEVVDGEAHELTNGDNERELQAGELPAIADVRALVRPGAAAVPVVQAAVLAASGFVAGAAAAALVRRRSGRRPGRSTRLAGRRSPEGLPVISTHTYLISVQVLGRSEAE